MTMPMTDEQIAEIAAREKAATEGPWLIETQKDGGETVTRVYVPSLLGTNTIMCDETYYNSAPHSGPKHSRNTKENER